MITNRRPCDKNTCKISETATKDHSYPSADFREQLDQETHQEKSTYSIDPKPRRFDHSVPGTDHQAESRYENRGSNSRKVFFYESIR